MPLDDLAGRRFWRWWRVLRVDDSELVLVVADAELDVAGHLKVRLDTQQLAVPLACRLQIGGEITDRGESSQH